MNKNIKQYLYDRIVKELNKPGEVGQFKKDASKLTGVDTRDNSWRMNLDTYMSKYGFRRFGSGKYASVYGNEKYPFVIKVFQKDSAYMRWLKFALSNKDNPYVPKIRGKVVKITPLVYAIRLEKLNRGYLTPEFEREFSQWERNPGYKTSDPALQQVFDFFEPNRKLLDLHGENVMMRGKQLVIIDPFYNWFGRENPGQYTIDPDDIDQSLF